MQNWYKDLAEIGEILPRLRRSCWDLGENLGKLILRLATEILVKLLQGMYNITYRESGSDHFIE